MMTSIHTMPSVSGTKRKWYIAVAANYRDRSDELLTDHGFLQMSCVVLCLPGQPPGCAMAPGSTVTFASRDERPPQRGDQRELDHDDDMR